MLAPFPWTIQVGPTSISAHGLFEAAAYAIAGAVYASQRRRSGDVVSDSDRSSVLVAAVLGALVGSKLLYFFEDPMLTLRSWTQPEYIIGGKTIVGGLLGGTAGVEWWKRRAGVTRRTGDLLTTPLILGMAIGRIGCFVSGLADHTYGIATSVPWGVDLGDGIARHPVQLYEVIFLGCLRWRYVECGCRRVGISRIPDFLLRVAVGGRLLETRRADPGANSRSSGLVWSRWAGICAISTNGLEVGRRLRMADRERPYLFYDTATSVCSQCLRRVDGKIVFEEGNVFLLKRCPQHGFERVLMADDVDYYRRAREVFLKPPEMPNRYNTPIKWGCPYDCGLCPDHEQHSCLSLIEVTDFCNLRCPVCYASSGPERKTHRSLEVIERMLDCVVRNERRPDVVQISGGEPTLHPDFFRILDMARERPIQHLMVNTNGTRIASDPEFVRRLAEYMPGFELYLQFDSLEEGLPRDLRGVDLRNTRLAALEALNKHGISTSLVVTVKRGTNDGELGRILNSRCSSRACAGGVSACADGGTLRQLQSGSGPADTHRGSAADS